MKSLKTNYTDFFQFNHFSEHLEIKHFISTRNKSNGKNLNISLESNMSHSEVLENRKLLSEAVNIPSENFVMQNQVHGDTVTIINQSHKGKGVYNHQSAIQNSDAMITNEKNICLFLFAADCMPVLFYDIKKRIIGACHSGWKGTVLKIAQKTIVEMKRIYNSSPEDILIGIGPSISVQNYEVGENVVNAVEKTFGTKEKYLRFNKNSGKYHFDMWYTVKQQLLEIGIPEKNIEFSGFCTYENNDLFFSARKKDSGRFGAGIMLT